MLRTPRRLPQRFNRPITPQTRRLVEQRVQRRREHRTKQVQRMMQRWQRRMETLRKSFVQFLFFAVPATVVAGVGFLVFSSVLHIREVRIPLTDPRIDVEQIQRGLAPLFGRHLFFLPERDAEVLAAEVVPDLAAVTVAKQYPATLEVRLTLDPLIARLAIDDPAAPPAAEAGTGATAPVLSDFLTEKGTYVAYADARVASGADLVQLHVVDWGVRPVPGTLLLEPEMLAAMTQAEQLLGEEFGRPVTLRTVFLRAREYHLKTPLHTLWFDLRTPVGDQLARYRTFLQAEGEGAAQQYVDLRLVDKVAYQ